MTLRSLSIALAASLALLFVASSASAAPTRGKSYRGFHPRALKGLGTKAPAKARSPRLAARKALMTHRTPGLDRIGAAVPKPPPRATSPRRPRATPKALRRGPALNRRDLSGRFPKSAPNRSSR
jgi:hypothetical protein